MDPVVTARVPAGVRDRGVDILRDIGSNTSELVNAAFDYVIQERRLPQPGTRAVTAGTRTLSPSQRRDLEGFMEGIRLKVPKQWETIPFEQLAEQLTGDRYADLR